MKLHNLIYKVDVPVSSAALESLIVNASSGSKDSGWDVGWSLVSADNGSQPSIKVSQIQTSNAFSWLIIFVQSDHLNFCL